jgi:hypothetical protein
MKKITALLLASDIPGLLWCAASPKPFVHGLAINLPPTVSFGSLLDIFKGGY